MIPMTLTELADVVHGDVHDDPGGVVVIGEAFLDSRAPVPGGLFAAFDGEHADGHLFAPAAVAAGAAAVLASRPVGVPAIVVADVQLALGRLAHTLLTRLPEVRVVAVTGSQGKTSTKDLLAVVLGEHAPTVATAGSFNNELGLPVTVTRITGDTRFLVLEMGARGVGHLRDLCAIARPSASVVLNVGKAHLGEFGSQEDIARAKGEIVDALPDDGLAVLNADDPRVAAMAARTTARVLTFGADPSADVRLEDLTLDDEGHAGGSFRVDGSTYGFRLAVVGEHQARNAAAVVAAAVGLGVPPAQAVVSLAHVSALSRWRMEVTRTDAGITVVNDSYNANPDSMEAGLRALVALARGRGRSLAVLGEMRELGASADAEHRAIGRLVPALGVDLLVVVGAGARAVVDGARGAGAAEEDAVYVEDHEAALAWLADHLVPDDVVLVKASRAAGLDRVAAGLLVSP